MSSGLRLRISATNARLSWRKSGSLCRLVGSGLSKSSVLAGEMTINMGCLLLLLPAVSAAASDLIEEGVPPVQWGESIGGVIDIAVVPHTAGIIGDGTIKQS